MSGVASAILGALIKFGFGGIVDKAISHMERRAKMENDRDRLRTTATIELAREAVKEAAVMADFNKAKLAYWPFWLLVFAVSAPFIVWMWAVIIDSTPYLRDMFGDQQVSDLPTPELRAAFGRMVEWVFYVGTGVGALKALIR